MSVAAAASVPQLISSYEIMLYTAMGSVRVSRPARMTEKRKLFQENTNERIAVATMPGLTSGSAMRQKTPKYEQPSISAASSRSAGTSSKNEIMTQMMIGSPTMRWVRIRAP